MEAKKHRNLQKEQAGADRSTVKTWVTAVIPGLLEEYAPASIFIMLHDISCSGK